MQQLTQNVFVDVGVGRPNPSFVVTTDGVFLVDSPELPQDALAFRDEVYRHGEPRYLVNLEHHTDHIVGNHFYVPPAIVVSHQGTRDLFEQQLGSPEKVRARIAVMDPEGVQIPDDYELRKPTLTYTERLTIYLGDHEFQLLNMPGHTPNQTVVWVPRERVMMAGGNVSCEIMPAMWGSLNLKWLEALDQMIAMEPEYVIPVHGPVTDVAYLRTFKELIGSWIQDVRDAIAKGWTKERAAEKIDYFGPFRMRPGKESMGKDWQTWNTIAIYEELTGQPRSKRGHMSLERYPKEALGR